jgi:hypothetical protein
MVRSFLRFGLASCLASVVAACAASPAAPPRAEFLLASGDSTFWVRTGDDGVRVRRSPLVLTAFDGRFYEVYVADDDRSFFDATFIGQRIYRRDLITNDSIAVFDDPVVPAFASAYAKQHPRERPLDPAEEGSENPATVVTTDAEIVDVLGPFLTFEHHTDVDIAGGEDSHETRRGVIDLRRGARASLASLFGAATADRLTTAGRDAFRDALDSVRAARDDRGRRAAEAIADFAFDSASFSLTIADGAPAIEFLVPGRGDRAGGLSLPLPPLAVAGADWWADVRRALPSIAADSATDEWHGPRYDVVARYDSTGDEVTLAIRDSTRREWSLGRFPTPAHRLYHIDVGAIDSAARRAIARAFDESVLYSEKARTAIRLTTPTTVRAVSFTRPARPARRPMRPAHAPRSRPSHD